MLREIQTKVNEIERQIQILKQMTEVKKIVAIKGEATLCPVGKEENQT